MVFFHRLIARALWFRRCFEEDEGKWYVRLEWKKKIPIRIAGKLGQDEFLMLNNKAWEALQNAKPEFIKDVVFSVRFLFRRIIRKTRKTVRMVAWRLSKRTDLSKLIICPRCHGDLFLRQGKMECGKCKIVYVIDGVIPILLLSCETFF